MKTITILCFQYPKTSYLHLPSSYIDLYWTYLYAISICNNIRVFTDLTEEDDISFSRRYSQLVEQHVINGGYMNLISSIKQRGHYCNYKNFSDIVLWFKQIVSEDIKESRHHMIYFTGHSVRQIMLFDIEHGIYLTDLIRLSDHLSRPYDQIFIILDCCLKETKFPFVYNQNGHWDDTNTLLTSSSSDLVDELLSKNVVNEYWNSSKEIKIVPTVAQMICWCSTRQNRAIASDKGSIFTNILFTALSKIHGNVTMEPKAVNLDLFALINAMMGLARNKYGLDFDVYSNRNNTTRIWPWIVNCPVDFYIQDGCVHLIIDSERPIRDQCPVIPEQHSTILGVELRILE